MNVSQLETALLEVDGVIERIDVLGRELTIRINGVARAFDLAPDCTLLLHGEPVKLRLLQELDRAHLAYARAGDELVAHQILVS